MTQLSLFEDNDKPKPRKATKIRRRGKKGTWDTEHYKVIYKWMREHVKGTVVGVYDDRKPDLAKHIEMNLALIPDCISREDYEGAQAVKDAIVDFLNELGAELPDTVEFKLPDYKPVDLKGIICYTKEDDLSGGMATGEAEWI